MNENISFRRMKVVIKSKGMTIKDVAEKAGKNPAQLSGIIIGRMRPKTGLLAKICSVLQVYPSEVVSFDGIEVNKRYFTDEKREPLPREFKGEVTYRPLWAFLADYLEEANRSRKSGEPAKTPNDLFDRIEPPRRTSGCYRPPREAIQKALDARFGRGHVAGSYRRTDYSRGLPSMTRVKLRNDRPLNLGVVYEICRFLGCTPDFIMSYK